MQQRDSPPPPVLKIQSPVRISSRQLPLTPPRKSSTGTTKTCASNSPSRHDQPQGHHSPDITFGFGSQLLLSKRRWSNSDSEELMDLDDEYVSSDATSLVVTDSSLSHLDKKKLHSNTPILPLIDFKWTPETQALFYRIMLDTHYRPIGITKYFKMMGVRHEFSKAVSTQVESKILWDHLATLYDLKELEKLQEVEYPLEEFSLSSALLKFTKINSASQD